MLWGQGWTDGAQAVYQWTRKGGDAIRRQRVNDMVVSMNAKSGFIVHLFITDGLVPESLQPLPLHLLAVSFHFRSGSFSAIPFWWLQSFGRLIRR